MEQHPDYDVKDEAEGDGDPPPDLYLADEAADAEFEDVAAKVLDMIHPSTEE